MAPLPSAASELIPPRADSLAGGRFLALGIGKSTVIDLPRDAKDVLVANPAIANAVVRSARRAYLIGVAPGQTNVIFFDTEGRQIAAYDIEVGRDASGVREALRRVMPNSSIRVDAVNDSVVLSGEVANAAQAQHAVDAAARLVGNPAKVVNGLTIRGGEQVLLKVTVAEVQRSVLKQLGFNLDVINVEIGSAVLNLNINNPFSVQGNIVDPPNGITPRWNVAGGTVAATLRAMEQSGVLRTLAEPNLTAISGEPAKFLAGGEFPVPAGFSCDNGVCSPTIEFKQFGVSLDFTPVVLSEGRISLKVATEVSELSNDGAIRLNAITIPALKVRRANSTVELPSGGSLVLAGLLQQTTRQNINGLPGLMNIPILGTLFRSRDYQSGETELMIMVTPYTVRPNSARNLARPDDGFANPDDPSTILLGRLNRIYGGPGTPLPQRAYHGSYGFILD
ncbi:MAG: type II and III secretion system protein family protein [Bradyrhizobiaceae bacterium]|nr:type II and III secretion system protein family protein [Bradyrhizobiaceae bacterium]